MDIDKLVTGIHQLFSLYQTHIQQLPNIRSDPVDNLLSWEVGKDLGAWFEGRIIADGIDGIEAVGLHRWLGTVVVSQCLGDVHSVKRSSWACHAHGRFLNPPLLL